MVGLSNTIVKRAWPPLKGNFSVAYAKLPKTDSAEEQAVVSRVSLVRSVWWKPDDVSLISARFHFCICHEHSPTAAWPM